MKRQWSVLWMAALCLLLAACAAAGGPEERSAGETRLFTDSTGREVELPEKITRAASAGSLANIMLYSVAPEPLGYTVFPEKQAISLEQLYLLGTIVIRDAFAYRDGVPYPVHPDKDSLRVVADTLDAAGVRNGRKDFLARQGIGGGEISLSKFASNAVNLLSEDVMVKE